MSTLKERAIRLLRERWPDANSLSEEIYAILAQEQEVETSEGITVVNEGDQSRLTFRGFGDDEVIFEIVRPDGTVLEITPGDLDFEDEPDPDPDPDEPDPDEEATNFRVVAGLVIAKLSETSYTVRDTSATPTVDYTATLLVTLETGEDATGCSVPLFLSGTETITASFTVVSWQP